MLCVNKPPPRPAHELMSGEIIRIAKVIPWHHREAERHEAYRTSQWYP